MTRTYAPRAKDANRPQTTMRLNEDVLTALAEIASERGWSRNFLAEQVLLAFVNDHGADISSIRQLLD